MSNYARLSIDDARQLMQQGDVTIVDIRDPESFHRGRIPHALHLDDSSVEQFFEQTDRKLPLIVCCYHGNTSQSAGVWLAQQGFAQVYSLDGGYAEWAERFPAECEVGCNNGSTVEFARR